MTKAIANQLKEATGMNVSELKYVPTISITGDNVTFSYGDDINHTVYCLKYTPDKFRKFVIDYLNKEIEKLTTRKRTVKK